MNSDDKEWLPSKDEEWLGLEDDSTSSNRYGDRYTHTLVPMIGKCFLFCNINS